eukprot:CAMPEP_0184378428 /NCGR_PEP_ID=MMETSP0007-20130409/3068_1 /TAXON_ID=97485 /ORGANISM="Prymnesium parvum, Strain Texoma1" /LENGTH=115 /DNA_ID=CAMNT_0026722717 /DNA_START=328 /DNA_END=672 /DNA_ORIENTATION=-
MLRAPTSDATCTLCIGVLELKRRSTEGPYVAYTQNITGDFVNRSMGQVRAMVIDCDALKDFVHIDRQTTVVQCPRQALLLRCPERDALLERIPPREVCIEGEQCVDQRLRPGAVA